MTFSTLRLGAARIATLIAQGEVTSAQVIDQHIAQIQKVNPALNAMVLDQFDSARAAAFKADALQQAGAPLGPLHGVPFTVKECLDLAGTPSTHGLQSRTAHRATVDEPHVARLRAAGAIPIAKTNVSQFLMYFEADNPVYGQTNNPWNLERTPGGSSGGEAALIAAGASPLGLGSDIGGSVRTPAAFSGIASLKPTAGRCDDTGDFWGPRGQRAIVAQVGPLAPFTADLALALRVMNGNASTAQTGTQLPALHLPPLLDCQSVDITTLRVAHYTDDGTFAPAPAVVRAVQEAAAALKAAGAQVTAWMPPRVPHALNVCYGILGADKAHFMKTRIGVGKKTAQISQVMALTAMPDMAIKVLKPLLRALGQPSMATALASFGPDSIAHYWNLVGAQLAYQDEFANALNASSGGPFDVILCPPSALPAFTHGASTELLTAGAYTALYNLLGYPAGVVPVTCVRASEAVGRKPTRDMVQKVALKVEHNSAGLPVGVQVVARPWREDVALAAMQVIESAVRQTQDFVPPGY